MVMTGLTSSPLSSVLRTAPLLTAGGDGASLKTSDGHGLLRRRLRDVLGVLEQRVLHDEGEEQKHGVATTSSAVTAPACRHLRLAERMTIQPVWIALAVANHLGGDDPNGEDGERPAVRSPHRFGGIAALVLTERS